MGAHRGRGRYAEGYVSYRVISAIAWHTDLVTDGEPVALMDTALAKQAAKWAPARWPRPSTSGQHSRRVGRRVEVGREHDSSELTAVWGKVYATDAAVLRRRLAEMAHGVCEDDPRTIGQRRADALGALAAGADRLACSCGNPDCPSAGDDGRASNVVIHVVTEAAALKAEPDPQMSGAVKSGRRPEPDPPDDTSPKPAPGLLLRGGIVPTPLLAELIRVPAPRCARSASRARHPSAATYRRQSWPSSCAAGI